MATIFIVKDNHDHLNSLITKNEKLGDEVVGSCNRAIDAISEINSLNPEIVLLDIHLNGDNDGIHLANQIKKSLRTDVIFTTAMTSDDVMEKAVHTNPVGYLVKPINTGELKAGIELAIFKRMQLTEKTLNPIKEVTDQGYLTVRTGFKLKNVKFEAIEVLQSDQKNYVTLQTTDDKKYSIRKSIKSLLESVLPTGFIQVHRHYIVNINLIKFISEREQMIEMKSSRSVPIGRTYKKTLYGKLNLV